MPDETSARSPRVVLLTGASTGLGLSLTRQLLEEAPATHLVLTARSSSLGRFVDLGISEGPPVMCPPAPTE